MPYLPSEAAKKSKLYNNIINGAEIEYQNEIEFLKQQVDKLQTDVEKIIRKYRT